ALEAEVDAFLGRARYQRSAAAADARPGSRNGYSPATVKTTAGPVTVARPQLRGITEALASKLFGTTVTKSNALESLVIAVFVALAAGGSESTDAWGDFLDELAGRGLRPPLLVISDGAAGLISAIESSLPRSLRQKCLIHRARNVLAKVPATAQDEIRVAYW